MSFVTNGSFDDTEVETSRQAIVSAYQAIARYYVDVKQRRSTSEEEHEVKYTILEGLRVYVQKLKSLVPGKRCSANSRNHRYQRGR